MGGYLVLMRRQGEVILIGDDIEIRVGKIEPTQVHLSIKAPRSIPILREELAIQMPAEVPPHETKQE